jgi:hypothetical protein
MFAVRPFLRGASTEPSVQGQTIYDTCPSYTLEDALNGVQATSVPACQQVCKRHGA